MRGSREPYEAILASFHVLAAELEIVSSVRRMQCRFSAVPSWQVPPLHWKHV